MSKFADLELYRLRADDARRLADETNSEVVRERSLLRASQYDQIVVSRSQMTASRGRRSRALATDAWMPLVARFYQDVAKWLPPSSLSHDA